MKRRIISAFLLAAFLLTLPCAGGLAAGYVSASTPLGDSYARISNIDLAAEAVNGISLPYGASFSFNDVVGARTARRGYQAAVNGRGVKVVGGGVAQVASTLYLALQQIDGISYDECRTYGSRYNQDYVSDASDAILVDAESGIDFAFTNYYADMTIEAYTSGGYLYCALNFDGLSGGDGQLAEATIYVNGSDALRNNVSLAAEAIDGTVLSNGDAFSFNDLVGARTKSRGYKSAVNGRGSKVVGGGVAQVASVIWLAIKDLDSISIVEKSTYGSRYNQKYVDNASDAILTDYKADTDFSFRYDGSGSIVINVRLSGDTLQCTIARSGDSGWSDSEVPTFTDSDAWW